MRFTGIRLFASIPWFSGHIPVIAVIATVVPALADSTLFALPRQAVGAVAYNDAAANTGTVIGTVSDNSGARVGYATVALTGLTTGAPIGAVADSTGGFAIHGVPAGAGVLRASMHGFRAVELSFTLAAGDTVRLEFVLVPEVISTLDAVTVTGTLKRTSVLNSPVKVEVIPPAVLQRSATNNLTEALQFVNGLYNQVDCGVCYTNSIRINGMEGPYTAVLIDGMPLMSSLASVYGLNGINPALIEQVEVIKGPLSTLYGSEAMAGVINVITKDPRFAPRAVVDVSSTTDMENNLDVAVSTHNGAVSAFASGNVAYNNRFVDRNSDGFTDFPLNKRGVAFGKLDYAPEGIARGSISTKFLYEDRFGGVAAWTPADRGSGEVYGESVYTHRFELFGSYTLPARSGLRAYGAYSWHDQDSWYGNSRYDARQQVAHGNLVWSAAARGHDLLLGASARWQTYDDNTPATAEADSRFIPGLFAQDEFAILSSLKLLAGARLDHHSAHGAILSPRVAAKWDIAQHTALRINAGSGFRVVNLFTEDHAALTGSRQVVINGALEPERSRSITLNLNQIVEFGPNPMMIDVDLFHTRFSNRIMADYDADPGLIVYQNLNGHAVTRGLAFSVNQNVDFDRFLWSAGLTMQDVYSVDHGARSNAFFAPRIRATLGATYRTQALPVRLDYTATVTGPMRLPEYNAPFERPTRSPIFSLHNLQATWSSGRGATEFYANVKNLFNYVQPTPLVAPDDPFGEHFDTAYIYGPMRGRHLMVGIRYTAAR